MNGAYPIDKGVKQRRIIRMMGAKQKKNAKRIRELETEQIVRTVLDFTDHDSGRGGIRRIIMNGGRMPGMM